MAARRRHKLPLSALPWIALALCWLVVPSTGHAEAPDELLQLVKQFFPQADMVGPFKGEPSAAVVYKGQSRLGYVFLTDQVVSIPAYSGKPISTLVGLDLKGQLTGVHIVHHEEPILVVGVSEDDLTRYIHQYQGKNAADRVKIGGAEREGYVTVDGLSGATITAMVLNRSIMASARKVAASRALIPVEGAPARSTLERQTASHPQDPVLDPIWHYAWRQKTPEIIALSMGLGVLGLILIFQDWLARHPSLLTYLRHGFLLYTLFFIGWYALAQLSVVNVLTFLHSAMHDFSWDTFLIDPLMFILWGFVAVTIVLWGRGVYCGWLCPFGALQELVFRLGRWVRLPTFEFPEVVHERLWAIKYIVLIMLFGLSLGSLETAVRYAEVEPFKTAVILHFQREWTFVAYAAGLVLFSAINRKFFCRYLCPLGAALTFPTRFRIFDWLRRRKECGRPCQTCAAECEVRAIGPTGEINERECHYCLDCQVTYWNEYKCPPMVERRKRRERAQRKRQAGASVRVNAPSPAGGPGRDKPVRPSPAQP